MSRSVSRGCNPTLGSSRTNSVFTNRVPRQVVRLTRSVSPPDKEGALIEPITEVGVVQAAASGDGITYLANAPTEPDPAGVGKHVQILSSRGAGSWSTRDLAIPHTSPVGTPFGEGSEYKFFDPELSAAEFQPFGEFIPYGFHWFTAMMNIPLGDFNRGPVLDLHPVKHTMAYRTQVFGSGVGSDHQ